MKKIILVSLLVCSWATQATIYRCEKNGVPVFSQTPCGKDAKQIKVRHTSVINTESNNEKQGELSVSDYLEIQDIDRKINQHRQNIKELKSKLAEEEKSIGEMSQATANYLGANSIDEAITQQTAIVRANYQAHIDNEQRSIERLTSRRENLNKEGEKTQ